VQFYAEARSMRCDGRGSLGIARLRRPDREFRVIALDGGSPVDFGLSAMRRAPPATAPGSSNIFSIEYRHDAPSSNSP
jgi:hypothetical protein